MKTAEQIADEALARSFDPAGGWRDIVIAAIEADRAQRAEPDEPIYWQEADEDQPSTHAFGADTAQIVDEEEGGAIAYCHRDNAHEIVRALLAYREKFA